ncbi:MAG: hypothetical protein KA004_00040 [Verrucomicrobiales bacterium]|nr:hypothetical protein [Verrucomicrobiales bacterium]
MKRLLFPALLILGFLAGFTWFTQAQGARPGGTNPAAANNNAESNPERIRDVQTTDHWWDCTLPGGNFCISIGKISSVSIHEYAVPVPTQTPGAVPLPSRVFEVNIGTDTALVARFYYVEAATEASALNVTKTAIERINQVANEAASRTGTLKLWQMVQKDYPNTTHAHTVEYRLESRDDLNRLYGSVKRAWLTGKGARFTIVNE